jgi:hypothetical protein
MNNNTILIQLTNGKAAGLLRELEELQLIKVLKKENLVKPKIKLSEKYRGIISKEKGKKLNAHIKQMRNEWNNI